MKKIKKLSKEHKKKISKTLKRKYASGKIKNWNSGLKGYTTKHKGYKHTKESKKKMSLSNSGDNHVFFGKKRPSEVGKKIRKPKGLELPYLDWYKEEVKQLGIKWIQWLKWHQEHYKNSMASSSPFVILHDDNEDIISFIKYIYDITEEDLK